MSIKTNVWFRLKSRAKTNSKTGIIETKTEDVLITMKCVYDSLEVELSTGYYTDCRFWDQHLQCVREVYDGKMTAADINNGLQFLKCIFYFTIRNFEQNGIKPSTAMIKEDFRRMTSKMSGIIQSVSYDEKKNQNESFFDALKRFIKDRDENHEWQKAHYEKYRALEQHLRIYQELKNKRKRKTFYMTFEYFTPITIGDYLEYLWEVAGLKNSTINKHFDFLRRFFRWAHRHGYHVNEYATNFLPKLKKSPKKVIFLDASELYKIENYHIPDNRQSLECVRDVFLFCCYTGLRYSDIRNLRRCDISEQLIEFTTIKTRDRLFVNLNEKSKKLLKKYENDTFREDRVLPVVGNAKMNLRLKELFKLAGIDTPIRITTYIRDKRIDTCYPKYQLIGTHAARRTFICMTIAAGIPIETIMRWTGHSDYKSMKPYIEISAEFKKKAMLTFEKFLDNNEKEIKEREMNEGSF